jgi:hypothetical protein
MQAKRKSVTELTKGFEKYIKGKKLNPNHKEDFERTAAGKRVKRVSPKVHRTSPKAAS